MPMLERALDFVRETASEGKQILFVGTKKQAGVIIKAQATACGMPYVDERWMGGLLTNFDTLKKRLKYLRELDDKYAKNDFGDMTKKERVELDRVYKSLNFTMGGLRDLKALPAAVFVASVLQDAIAVREAKKLKLPVVAMVDTNADPTSVTYPIPSNDDAKKAIDYVVGLIGEACSAGKVPTKKIEEKKEETTSAEPELVANIEEGNNGN
jgi:small subunit ribosomal protein S2